MPALNLDTDAQKIAARLADSDTLLVACLCAQWCNTCEAYRHVFDRLANIYTSLCFVWIDIETHADWLGELDVEDFPTILIEDAHHTHFFGAVSPRSAIVKRLIAGHCWHGTFEKPKLRPKLTEN